MKYITLLLLLALSLSAEELYQQPDKQKHFMASMAISGTATGIARYYGSSKLEAGLIGIGTSLLVGVAKEALDKHGDVQDVYADTLGSVVGSTIATQLNWRF